MEPAAAGAPQTRQPTVCAACKSPIDNLYYTAGEQILCPACREGVVQNLFPGTRVSRFLRAAGFGILVSIAGAALWYGVRWMTGYDLGLIAVAVGFGVGLAVRKGAHFRGGIGYQLLAVVLTYLTICASYAPVVVNVLYHGVTEVTHTADGQPESVTAVPPMIHEEDHMPVALQMVVAGFVILVSPILVGKQSLILVLIYLFALWEAWKLNRRIRLELSGPFSLAPPPPLPSAPAA